MSPGGVRIGAPALTTRGMKEPEFRQIAQFMSRAAELAIKIQASSGKMLKDFTIAIEVGRVRFWFLLDWSVLVYLAYTPACGRRKSHQYDTSKRIEDRPSLS